jgi:ketosteroid isomerase-like protein
MADNPVEPEVVEGFYAAYAGRDAARFAEFLDDGVEWTVSGPVDVLPYCGTHYGKAAVLDVFERRVPEMFSAFHLVRDSMLLDGNRVATLNRWTGRRADDGRMVSYRLAHFMRFRSDKLVANVSLIDSYDAAEQVLGHSLADHSIEPAHGENLVRV